MFRRIHLTNLRKSEFLNFFMELVDRCKRFDVVALLIGTRVAALTAESLKLKTAYNKDGGSDITDVLEAIDDRRDHGITGIKLGCEGFIHSFLKPIADAARLILGSIEKHPAGIARMNYKAETSEINSLILEWEGSTEMTAALETLGFTSWVAELKEANALFAKTEQDRIDDKHASEGDSFSELRPDAMVVYDKLCKGVAAHYELDENPEHLKLVDTINLIIDEYNLILTKREGGNDDDANDDEGTDSL
jgi:hypothetical protein